MPAEDKSSWNEKHIEIPGHYTGWSSQGRYQRAGEGTDCVTDPETHICPGGFINEKPDT